MISYLQVIGEMAGGKAPGDIHTKVERSVILMAEVLGAEDFCRSPVFYNICLKLFMVQ